MNLSMKLVKRKKACEQLCCVELETKRLGMQILFVQIR